MERLTVSEIARRCGLNKSTVSRQVRARPRLRGPDGLIDLAEYQAARQLDLDPAKRTAGVAAVLPVDADVPGLASARARQMQAMAEMAQLNLARAKRVLVSAAEADAEQEAAFREVVDAMLHPGDLRELAAELAECFEPRVIESRIRRYLTQKLADCAASMERDADNAVRRPSEPTPAGATGGGESATPAA
jgi:AcrR family transcriptional regulator